MPEELRRKIADIVFSVRAGGDIKGFSVENSYTPLKIKNIWMIYMKAFADDWIPAFAGMTREWPIGCPEGTCVTVCLIPSLKFIVYRDDKKIWEFHL